MKYSLILLITFLISSTFAIKLVEISSPQSFANWNSHFEKSKVPILKFCGLKYDNIFVNDDGIISFGFGIGKYEARNISSFGTPVFAPFYADIDVTKIGKINYQLVSTNKEIREFIRKIVQVNFKNEELNWFAENIFVVTWNSVASYDTVEPMNTFQTIITWDHEKTFVVFLYKDINWIHKYSSIRNFQYKSKVQVGLFGSKTCFKTLNMSSISDFSESNIDMQGAFAFDVSNSINDPIPTSSPSKNKVHPICTQCSKNNATCQLILGAGRCCTCSGNYFGDGKTCLHNAINPVIDLTFNINVNSIRERIVASMINIDQSNVFSVRFGSSSQFFRLIPDFTRTFDFLFSSTNTSGLKNGFQLGASYLKSKSTIHFLETDQRIETNLVFQKSLLSQNKFLADIEINGTIPYLEAGAVLKYHPVSYIYKKIGTGYYQGVGQRIIEETSPNPKSYIYSIVDEVTFHECKPNEYTTSLNLTILTMDWSNRNQTNFAVSSKGVIFHDRASKCIRHQCHPDAYCADTERCVCKPGFEGNGIVCSDVNECLLPNSCDFFAKCTNTISSYNCKCIEGYEGNGKVCKRKSLARDGDSIVVIYSFYISQIFANDNNYFGDIIFKDNSGNSAFQSVKYNCRDQIIYFMNVTHPSLMKFDMKTNSLEILLNNNEISKATTFEIDSYSHNIFVAKPGKIIVGSLTSNVYAKYIDVKNPSSLAFDTINSLLYWIDLKASNNSKINRFNGSAVEIVVEKGLELPTSLALDQDGGQLCWIEFLQREIKCLTTKFKKIRSVLKSNANIFHLTILNAELYWTTNKNEIATCSLYSENPLVKHIEPALGIKRLASGITHIKKNYCPLKSICYEECKGGICVINNKKPKCLSGE